MDQIMSIDTHQKKVHNKTMCREKFMLYKNLITDYERSQTKAQKCHDTTK
jgi:hypothetical protein